MEDASLCLFHGRAPRLECVGWSHNNPRARPRAWVSVDLRLGEPNCRDIHGRSTWPREIQLEARLPEAHARRIAQDTDWPSSDGRGRRVRLAPRALHTQLREYERSRLRDDVWRPPLIPPRVWIDPGRTPREVTTMALLLILWQEGFVGLGPEGAPDAWAWVRRWTRSQDDGACYEIVAALRRNFVAPEDWRALPMYRRKLTRRWARRADLADYARPLRDELDEAMTAGGS
jgi:hypothetical protein